MYLGGVYLSGFLYWIVLGVVVVVVATAALMDHVHKCTVLFVIG